ncbi:MAG: hypothetical protein M3124_09995 [Actinomycetota bacterium]|nr:hypothetical protein [Actinomycetota bacterium]
MTAIDPDSPTDRDASGLGVRSRPQSRKLGVIASGAMAGAIAGLVAGGIGSRLAMRVLAITTPAAEGAITEADATVGQITAGGTLFLLLFGTALGVGGGLAYLALRHWLPARWRGPAFGLLLLAIAGPFLVDPDNPDFVILEPAWLGVAMFAALPVLFGLLVAQLQARLEPFFTRQRSRGATTAVLILGLLPLALGGPVAIALVLIVGGGLALAHFTDAAKLLEARAVGVAITALLIAVTVFGLIAFARSVLEILT